ncbi:AAA ATPase domain-containing protein [Gracilibacillus ureilyticus]|uniref:AAA ATPase domain-containing protein n=2 Tax=Gracilibacillus ureilyticus TaxID=531814 RepID=A0A1H9MMF5_9BACI|nr:AAA ATPase domain-containing protein [Gracilibacillus ureilyticus]
MSSNVKRDVMVSSQDTSHSVGKIEEEYFVGRKEEIRLFREFILQPRPSLKVLHIFGTGGIGKTYLLNAFARISKKENVLFLPLDSQDYIHTPAGFAEYLIQMLEISSETPLESPPAYSLQTCFRLLDDIAKQRRMVIAIDTYEMMDDLDRWFRQVFVQTLPDNILVVLSGRKQLKNEWTESAAWRHLAKQIELNDFTLEQSRTYLNRFNIKDEKHIEELWQFTNGHPLTLSLATLTKGELSAELLSEDSSHILLELTERWLREVEDEETHNLIYVAALFHSFDQSSLSAVLNRDIPLHEFNKLISLSFVRVRSTGWAIHDLIRDAIQVDLQHRNLDYYHSVSERIAEYYYKRTIETRSPHDIAQFFYHLKNDFIQSAFFQQSMDSTLYLEPVEAYNFQDVEAFFKYKKQNIEESEARFFNRSTNKSYHFYASLQHNKKEVEFVGPEYIQKMGYETTNLLKNKQGKTLGLSIIVPINQDTLKYLAAEPVSRAYFDQLSEEELDSFKVPAEESAGWYIRHLDYIDHADISAMSYLLYNLFTLSLPGGKIITSTPIKFFQDLLGDIGFEEVPDAVSFDFGEDIPSPTYILDVSGAKLAIYLKQFTNNFSSNNKLEVIADIFSLTNQEKRIVGLILHDKSNSEIAEELFVAEVTVKKHISSILKKTGTKNRSQLINEIMKIV